MDVCIQQLTNNALVVKPESCESYLELTDFSSCGRKQDAFIRFHRNATTLDEASDAAKAVLIVFRSFKLSDYISHCAWHWRITVNTFNLSLMTGLFQVFGIECIIRMSK